MPDTADLQGRDLLHSIIDGFRANLPALRDPQTSEAVIRAEYIDPLFIALGWDIRNVAHRSPAEKDVVIEARVGTIEGPRLRSRRPDYLFRIDGFPRFIVEAKRPAIDLHNDMDAVFQAKTYAWSAQIPFAILTDFEEFRLYDATLKPDYAAPDRGLIVDFDLRFEDYLPQWDVLHATFGRDAVATGSLERLLARIKNIRAGRRIRGIDRMLLDLRGSELVDRAFLAHLQEYRKRIACEIYRENKPQFPDAHTRHGAAKLTEAVQRLIDRLIFIRVCEDRDISPWAGLRDIVNRAADEKLDLYPLLIHEFQALNSQYNGYLFKPHFSETLAIPAQLLADFIASLYLPDGPYRFDAIADDILGIVYERFLGNVITVTNGIVQSDPKPEVRHARGVYYTPRFVVDTIIRRTVRPRIQNLTPTDLLNIKILDPACGSGSFLVAAFQYLMDHCIRYFTAHPDAARIPATPRARTKKKDIAFKDKEGNWCLAPDFKATLLTSCLHGVDIDAQAVEVTIMSLYLKMLEGELPPHWQQDWLENELLPSLDNNIRCGNSLLSQTDFDRWWDNQHGSLFAGNEDVRFRMNPFDWTSATRGFGRILPAEGKQGFDCIIGNPPYIRVQELNQWAPDECEFYKWRYDSARRGNYDIYIVFIERALELLSPEGLLGFICPHKYWQATYGEALRGLLATNNHLHSIIDFTDQQVFRGATTYTAIQVFSKNPAKNPVVYARVTDLQDGDSQCRAIDAGQAAPGIECFPATRPSGSEQWYFRASHAASVITRAHQDSLSLFPKICRAIFQGIITGADDVFLSSEYSPHPKDESLLLVKSEASGIVVEIEKEITVPVIRRQGFRSYIASPDHILILPYDHSTEQLHNEATMRRQFPRAWDYLHSQQSRLVAREAGRFANQWWCLSRPQNIRRWCAKKILVPYMSNRLQAVWDEGSNFFVNVTTGGYGLELNQNDPAPSPFYIVGLLNSRLMDYILRSSSSHFHSGYFPANKQFIQRLPIKMPTERAGRQSVERIEDHVEQIVTAKKHLQSPALSDHDLTSLERQVESHESTIDELVCRLYGVDHVPST